MSRNTLAGSCLCGAIRYEVEGPARYLGNCHCPTCRKQHGSAFSTYADFDAAGWKLLCGDNELQTYRSSPPVKRQFCGVCGSNLFYLDENEPDKVWVAAGTLDDDPGTTIGGHIFVGSKAPWYHITDSLPQCNDLP